MPAVSWSCSWRGAVDDDELNALHAEAFQTRVFTSAEWPWVSILERHSLGWVVARDDHSGALVGFLNVPWDGLAHAWLQDVMVASRVGRQGIGTALVGLAVSSARAAGCEWLHVDFSAELAPFYLEFCGFTPTSAGLIQL